MTLGVHCRAPHPQGLERTPATEAPEVEASFSFMVIPFLVKVSYFIPPLPHALCQWNKFESLHLTMSKGAATETMVSK